jgi:FkbM family methyltransferase
MLDLIRRLLSRRHVPLEVEAYRRLQVKGFAPATIIDIGAYEGHWTRLARGVFPDVPVLMVEAQPAKIPHLETVARDLGGVTLVSALLSDRPGEELTFYEMETGSSILPENSNVSRIEQRLLSRTLDEVASSSSGPIFLKIDVQGAELSILRGGLQTLDKCEVVQLETALLPYNDGAPQIVETMTQMQMWGFVPYDFAGFIRPNGVDLVQTDIIFVRENSPLRPRSFVF